MTSKVPYLHELLAVLRTQQSECDKLHTHCEQTVRNKHHLFTGATRTLTMFGQSEDNTQELRTLEDKEKVHQVPGQSVMQQLLWAAMNRANLLNVTIASDRANTKAAADVVVDGQVILENVPSQALVGLEGQLKRVRDLVDVAPTLDPAKTWHRREDVAQRDLWQTAPIVKVKTQKTTDHRVVVPATDRHPAQVIACEDVRNVGRYEETEFSTMMSIQDKVRILARIDKLIRAVVSARMRANTQEAPASIEGDLLMEFIFGERYDRSQIDVK